MTSHHPATQPPFPPADPDHRPPRAHRRRLAKPCRRWEFNPWLWAGLVVVILGVVLGLMYAKRDPSPPTTRAGAPIVTTTPSATPSVTPAYDLPEGAFAGDGGVDDPLKVYVVGRHIQPGRYTLTGALDPEVSGHWELLRLRTAGALPSRVDGEEVVGPQTVTLRAGDIIETRGLKPWHLAPEE